jgi:hypothetical protein
MTQNDTSFRMSVFWAPWEYGSKYAYYHSLLRYFVYKIIYDIKAVIAFFLRKMQQNFAQSQCFPIHTTKRVVLRFHKINAPLRLAENSQILPT